ncbi:hypothetical protein EJB05_02836, partial [Eragrostis curvula]
MCWRRCSVLAAVFVYSSVSGSWTHGTTAWAAIGLDVPVVNIPLMCWWHGYAYGCVYWDAGISNKMIQLSTAWSSPQLAFRQAWTFRQNAIR